MAKEAKGAKGSAQRIKRYLPLETATQPFTLKHDFLDLSYAVAGITYAQLGF